MNDKANHKAPTARTACQICGREFCDPQTSTDDLIECYRLGYERLGAKLAIVEQVAESRGRMLSEAQAAPAAPKEPQP